MNQAYQPMDKTDIMTLIGNNFNWPALNNTDIKNGKFISKHTEVCTPRKSAPPARITALNHFSNKLKICMYKLHVMYYIKYINYVLYGIYCMLYISVCHVLYLHTVFSNTMLMDHIENLCYI